MSGAPALALELPWHDPADCFLRWAHEPWVAWLDSQGPADARARHSVLAIEPFHVFTAEAADADPFETVAGLLAPFRGAAVPAPVPFTGGAVGFLGYELGCRLERVGRHHGLAFPDACFGLYDLVLAFDRLHRRTWLFSSGLPERDPQRRATRARARADMVLARLHEPAPSLPPAAPCVWRAETTPSDHMSRVAQTVARIEAGEMCQANITARFLAARPPETPPAALHLALRAKNPAPYGAYLGCGPGRAVASVSPERFLGLTASGSIEARPIKGTRARSSDPDEDRRLAHELRTSAKDHAENLMIVDLLRHDIGRVAQIGSVHVPELAVLESFANIHHLVSVVHGRLRPGLSAVDLLRAAFPCGSVTGAPKRQAMRVIHTLEPAPRGPYCGAIAWFGWDGAMDSAVGIRTLTITPDQVIAQAGGGIVADSEPSAEHEEMMVKLRPLLLSLGGWADDR